MEINRGLINISAIIHVTKTPFLIESTTISTHNVRKEVMEWQPNTFQPRAIRGGYNPRYYNSGVEIYYIRNYNQNNVFQKNSIPPHVLLVHVQGISVEIINLAIIIM